MNTSIAARRSVLRAVGASAVAMCGALLCAVSAQAQTDMLPSWNDCTAQKTIVNFVPATSSGMPVNTFQAAALYAEATQQGWTVISMKDVWEKIFAFDA